MDRIAYNFPGRTVVPREKLLENIDSAFKRKLPFFVPQAAREGSVVICGSGPSLKDNLEAIREHRDEGRAIVAVKGAHDFLVDNEIVPDYAVGLDPVVTEPFKRKNSHTIYFIASQSHPSVFDYLSGCFVVMWHSMLDADLSVWRGQFPVWGGSTSGLRAITLFHVAGIREFWVYGFDGSFADGKRRIEPGERGAEPSNSFETECDGRVFRTCPEMARQVLELQTGLLPNLRDSVFHFEGDGLLQHAMGKYFSLPEEERYRAAV